jgi:ketosteroid isomerase-like protein
MADHPDADIVWRGHQAANDNDVDTIRELVTDDVRWHTPGRSPLAGTIEGQDALIRDFFEPLRDAPLRIETHDAVANDEHVVSIATLHVEFGGETRSFRFTEVCHTRDGKISERWVLAEDQYGVDETLGQLAGG